HLADARNERKLALERRSDVRGHGHRARPGECDADLNGREVHVWQRRHGQVDIADDPHQQERDRDQRGRDRTMDEGAREAHWTGGFVGAGRLTLTAEPAVKDICPSVTTVSPGLRPVVITAVAPSVSPTLIGRIETFW